MTKETHTPAFVQRLYLPSYPTAGAARGATFQVSVDLEALINAVGYRAFGKSGRTTLADGSIVIELKEVDPPRAP